MKAFFLKILTIACICKFLAKKNIYSTGWILDVLFPFVMMA